MKTMNASNFLKHEVDINPAFDSENLRRERNNKWSSAAITILFHAVILLLLFYLLLKPPFPPLSDQGGVFLNIGLVEVGMGDVQPMGNATELQAPSETSSSSKSSTAQENIITQNNEVTAPVVKNDNKPKSNNTAKNNNTLTPKNTNNNTTVQQPKPKALYPGNTTNNSTSQGTGNQQGDQGKPNGNPWGTDYNGNPGVNGGPGGPGKGGNGLNFNVPGRYIMYYPPINDNSQKVGRVIVNIKVDKKGNVIYAEGPAKGSTTSDIYLVGLAKEAALKTKINADEEAADEQPGTITYNFLVK